MADILDFQTFDQTVNEDEFGGIYVRNNTAGILHQWVGSCSSFVAGPGGVGRAARAPDIYLQINTSSYKSGGVRGKAKFRASGAQDLVRFDVTGGSVTIAKLRKTASEFWEIADATASPTTSTATAPAVDEWFEFELWVHWHNTQGRIAFYVNGSAVADLNLDNIDTIHTAFDIVGRIRFTEADIDVIDVVPMGKVGKFTDADLLSQPGRAVKIAALYPTANGTYTAWSIGAGSGALYEQVDEVGLGNGLTDYLTDNVADTRVSFLHQAMPTSETIYAVLAAKVSQQQSTGSLSVHRGAYPFLRIGSSNYDGGEAPILDNFFNGAPGSWSVVSEVWPTDPSTLSVWTTPAIDALQSGARTHSGATDWLSQSVIYVLYVTQPAPEPPRISSSLVRFRKMHRLVNTWLVQRTDEVEMAFTDHDHQLELDGVTYEPAGGFSGSAIRRELMLKDQSQQFLGAITSDAVTVDDLRAGRYRDATIVERIVDWRYPWLGDAQRNVYWIGDVNWNGKAWKVELNGLAQRLQRRRKKVVARTCGWDLFGLGCLVSPTPHTYTGLTVSSVVDRYTFLAGGLGTFADDWFTDGDIVWTAGANIGIMSEVRGYVGSNDRLDLYIRTPFPITTSDTFTLRAGCDKLPQTCKSKFNNFANFGGFPFIPGRNKAMRGR